MQDISLTPGELQYFGEELAKRKTLVYDYLSSPRFKERLQPEDIYESSYLYLSRQGKALRPAYLLWCCGACGGPEREPLGVVPAAAIETYHTWGLVHDDIIDMDDLRRGGPTVHRLFEQKARERYGYEAADAERYGLAVAILAGDSLMGWTVSLLAEMFSMPEIDPEIPRFLIEEFSNRQIPVLINGEITDVFYEKIDIDALSEADLMAMSYNKTGSIFAFAGMIGAMIGLNRCDREHPYVQAVQDFATKSGMAFQLVDDVINIIGEADAIGKPVGSDIHIGKRTIPIIYALHHASEPDRSVLRDIFGNPDATGDDIAEAIRIVKRAGGVDHTVQLSYDLAAEALEQIEVLPESEYKQLIRLLGRRLVDRKT